MEQRVDTSEFYFEGSGLSALLVHGLSGTPYEMRYVGERLAAEGIRVLGVKLAGHAAAPEELGESDHLQWRQSVADGFARLVEFREPIVAVGLSLGAVLCSQLAIDQNVGISGVALLSPAFFLPQWITIALKAFSFSRALPKIVYLRSAGSDIADDQARAIHPSSKLMPLSGPINLVELSALVRPRLGRLTQPALIMHARNDHVAPLKNLGFAMTHLGSEQKRAVILEKSFHVMTVDVEKDQVAQEVAAFARSFRGASKVRALA